VLLKLSRAKDTVEVVELQHKGPYLDTVERFYLYNKLKENLVFNDNLYELSNPIFEAYGR
jgi:hypothetical protein